LGNCERHTPHSPRERMQEREREGERERERERERDDGEP